MNLIEPIFRISGKLLLPEPTFYESSILTKLEHTANIILAEYGYILSGECSTSISLLREENKEKFLSMILDAVVSTSDIDSDNYLKFPEWCTDEQIVEYMNSLYSTSSSYKTIERMDIEELDDLFESTILSEETLSDDEREFITIAASEAPMPKINKSIPNKKNMAVYIAGLLKNPFYDVDIEYIKQHVQNSYNVLLVGTAYCNGVLSLEEPTKFEFPDDVKKVLNDLYSFKTEVIDSEKVMYYKSLSEALN